MFTLDDTICAVSTPAGVGGIAVVRVSGPRAFEALQKIWQGTPIDAMASHSAHLGTILDMNRLPLDNALLTIFRNPRSFTGQDVAEVSVHGSQYVQAETLRSLVGTGLVRIAEPGEFTRRAYANGRLDLAQAEAVADIISSTSRAAHRLAINQMRGAFSQRLALLRQRLIDIASLLELELDFSEEDVTFASREQMAEIGRAIADEIDQLTATYSAASAIRQGIPVAIVGVTNAGKSTLLNALVGDDRAIVSDIHGTTRDTIQDVVEIGGNTFRFVDTAGLRDTRDTIENMGIERSLRATATANIILHLVSPEQSMDDALAARKTILTTADSDARIITLLTKSDVGDVHLPYACDDERDAATLSISVHSGEGMSALRDTLVKISHIPEVGADTVMVTNARHYQALKEAREAIGRALQGIETGDLPGDLIAQDIRQTIASMGSITGDTITTSDLLQTIFSRFCIGK